MPEEMPDLPEPKAEATQEDEDAVLRKLYGEPNADGVFDGEEK
ncbi:hypothetical protein [Spirillospora sp. NPDC047279]